MHELALAGLSDGLHRGKTKTRLSVLQRRDDVGGQWAGRSVLPDAVGRDSDRLDAGIERKVPTSFGEPRVDVVRQGHPAECPQAHVSWACVSPCRGAAP